MKLEKVYFKKNFYYSSRKINKYIAIIKFSTKEIRTRSFKNLVFKMMKDIVKKNVNNYIKLLQNSGIKEIPEKDELISECYIIFDKCLGKFEISKNNNFYFYYNKSLSRYFFRNYQKEVNKNNAIEITDSVFMFNSNLQSRNEHDELDLILKNIGLTSLEIQICYSKINGQKAVEFLEKNTEITSVQYTKSIKRIKEVLIDFKNKDEI